MAEINIINWHNNGRSWLGSDIPRILRAYGEDCFKFTDNFIRIIFPVSTNGAAHDHASVQVKKLIFVLAGEKGRSELQELLGKNTPTSTEAILNKLEEFGFCKKQDKTLWSVTNLGAILFANHASDYTELEKRTVIVRKYVGTNNRNLLFEQIGGLGYAVGFENLIDFIMKNTSSENIEVIREAIPTYPRVAIREFVANALVHQDFAVTGMPITIEIFSNRLVITNPGALFQK